MADSSHDAPERKPISRRLRFEILRRDGHQCRYCGAGAPDVELQVDHVVPVALGGTNEPSNLTTACRKCNAGKSSASPDASTVEAVNTDAERWAAAMQRAAEIQRNDQAGETSIGDAFFEKWLYWFGSDTLDPHWRGSIQQFTRAGLTIDDLQYAIATLANKDDIGERYWWRYFCGVCWKIVNDRQELARQLLEGE